MPDSNDTFVGLTKSKAALGLAVVAILMSALSTFSAVITLNRTSQQAEQAQAQALQGVKSREVLCSIKRQQRGQIHDSQAYLVKHPDGAPAIGLSRVDILRSITKSQAFVRQFNSLGC